MPGVAASITRIPQTLADSTRRWVRENCTTSAQLAATAFLLLTTPATHAQVSLRTAVALALHNSPRARLAQDDTVRATAAVQEQRDYYIPSLGVGGGIGKQYGISLNIPTILTVNAQSLIYSPSQRNYLRAAKQSLLSSAFASQDVAEQIEEDVAITYVSLAAARQKYSILQERYALASKLVDITEQRAAAGLESDLELKRSQRVLAQIRMETPQAEHYTHTLEQHLNLLTGVDNEPPALTPQSIPPVDPADLKAEANPPESAAIRSAAANASAKSQQAEGDARYLYRPQVQMQSQYGRISPINDVSSYYNLNGRYNTFVFGVAVQVPLLDKVRQAKARESAAEAQHAMHEVDLQRTQRNEDYTRLYDSYDELAARADFTRLDHEIVAAELAAVTKEANTRSTDATGGRQLNPKDELFARLNERQKALDAIDAQLQMQRTQITLLRLNGHITQWLTTAP